MGLNGFPVGDVNILDIVPEKEVVLVWESSDVKGGEGMTVHLVGPYVRVSARIGEYEGSGVFSVDRLLDALGEQARKTGS